MARVSDHVHVHDACTADGRVAFSSFQAELNELKSTISKFNPVDGALSGLARPGTGERPLQWTRYVITSAGSVATDPRGKWLTQPTEHQPVLMCLMRAMMVQLNVVLESYCAELLEEVFHFAWKEGHGFDFLRYDNGLHAGDRVARRVTVLSEALQQRVPSDTRRAFADRVAGELLFHPNGFVERAIQEHTDRVLSSGVTPTLPKISDAFDALFQPSRKGLLIEAFKMFCSQQHFAVKLDFRDKEEVRFRYRSVEAVEKCSLLFYGMRCIFGHAAWRRTIESTLSEKKTSRARGDTRGGNQEHVQFDEAGSRQGRCSSWSSSNILPSGMSRLLVRSIRSSRTSPAPGQYQLLLDSSTWMRPT